MYICTLFCRSNSISTGRSVPLNSPSSDMSCVVTSLISPDQPKATASTVPLPSTLSLPLLIPNASSILASGSPLLRLIIANVITPASTYVLPWNPLLPTSRNSSSAWSAIRCLASSTRSTGLLRGSGNADCGGDCIIVSEGRFGEVLRRGSNCEADEGEK